MTPPPARRTRKARKPRTWRKWAASVTPTASIVYVHSTKHEAQREAEAMRGCGWERAHAFSVTVTENITTPAVARRAKERR